MRTLIRLLDPLLWASSYDVAYGHDGKAPFVLTAMSNADARPFRICLTDLSNGAFANRRQRIVRHRPRSEAHDFAEDGDAPARCA